MSRNTPTVTFQTLEIKGTLLPGSLLEDISKLERPKEMLLQPGDYGLSRGERLRGRIDAAWVLTKELWEEYGDLKGRAGQSIAGQHFGMRLLREVFNWNGIEACNGWRQGESSYAINYRAFAGSVPLILRGIEEGELHKGSAQFGQEGRRRSPHSCLQECLNADDSSNWGMLISGDRLRLLHDNPSLVKPSYLAADLELLIEGDFFDEFSVLWLLLHASRFQHPQTGSCVLDNWKQKAEASGERVLGALRGGVQSALQFLGSGFLNHPANSELRDALFKHHTLSKQHFHEQLLRLVYRFLFLFTAEDRGLLFPRDLQAVDPRWRIYRAGYSVSRLRELAINRSSYEGDYGDLWELQRLVFQQLSIGNSPLGLPGLGGLFSLEQCPDLQAAELWNGPLLRAIKAIGWFDADGSFTRVRYRDLNTEELGSVYEGLLELHPQLEQQGSQWQLSYGGGAGSDRKTTGSYYTPDALVQELIKSALIPVIDDRLSKAHSPAEQEQALLKIKVIDPACGSGHFLLAAARRLAVALAQVRAGDDQPSEDDRQHALRDVVAHCIYAVDKNPMAVELCKVALWIEAIDPGKPLSFLDAHIQCGDSLVGVFDPKVLEEGIPDGAFKPLTGDNKTVCTSLKKENAAARKTISRRGSNRGIQGSLALSGTKPRSQGQQALQAIEAMPETTLAETAAKQAAYAQWLSDRGQDPEALAADLYSAAFFLAKTSDSRATVPTTDHLLKLLAGQPVDEAMEDAVVEAAQNFRFFHWHLRFGEVMEQGGFDCVLGNPPWEVLEEEEKKFFASSSKEIANAPGARRKALIASLETSNPQLFKDWIHFSRERESFKSFHREHPCLTQSSYKKLNLYASFLEITSHLVLNNGKAGLIIQGGLLSDESRSRLSAHLMQSNRMGKYFEFTNKTGLFSDIHRQQSFAAITISGATTSSNSLHLAFDCESVDDTRKPEKLIRLNPLDMILMSPIDGTVPKAGTAIELSLIAHIYRRIPAFCSIPENKGLGPQTIFNITTANDAMDLLQPGESIVKPEQVLTQRQSKNWLPLMEGKFITNFSCRNSSFRECSRDEILKGSSKKIELDAKGLAVEPAMPRWWMKASDVNKRMLQLGIKTTWMLGFCDVTNAENQRTALCSFLPATAAAHTLWIFTGELTFSYACMICACINSLAFDYVAKRRVSSRHLTKAIFLQLPMLPLGFGKFECPWGHISLENWITSRIALIYSNTKEIDFPVDNVVQETDLTPCVAKAEIDACLLAIFLANKERHFDKPKLDSGLLEKARSEQVPYILSSFNTLKEAEIKLHGEFRSKRLVLEAWDRLFFA